jgi:hypothetical protein
MLSAVSDEQRMTLLCPSAMASSSRDRATTYRRSYEVHSLPYNDSIKTDCILIIFGVETKLVLLSFLHLLCLPTPRIRACLG